MSFNLGSNDRNPSFGGKPPSTGSNPLSQAIHSSEHNKGGDMILTKDHPGWSGGDHPSNTADDCGAHAHGQRSSSPNATLDNMPQRPPAAIHSGAPSSGGYDRRPDSQLPSNAVPRGARFDPILPGATRPSSNSRQGGVGRNDGPLSGEPDYDDMLPPGCA
ncbi:hypothetical protein BGZ73_006550 [Actinomortierella ambigua]|nr:hypothetical protein BGZ73_006550 [Actinomortierella ambigua]